MRLAVLVDYRGSFWSSTTNVRTGTSMNVPVLLGHMRHQGLDPVVAEYAEVDVTADWSGVPVVYTSAEDSGLRYKAFIEDTVQALEMNGARTLPGHPLLRAHHNKVFMEFLRKTWLPSDELSSGTRAFGTLEEFIAQSGEMGFPAVVKSASGAGSVGVRMADDADAAVVEARGLSKSDPIQVELRERLLAIARPGYQRGSTHRSPFIVQRQIPGLAGDFKVLKYGRRYFAVFRENRPDQTLASGSGRLRFDIEEFVDVDRLLGFAMEVADRIPSPWLSLDIAQAGDGFELIEFQAIHFGPATLEKGSHHFVRGVDGNFDRVEGNPGLEEAFVDALVEVL